MKNEQKLSGNESAVSDAVKKESSEMIDQFAEPVDTEQPPRLPFPIVGMGASSGGLEAFSEFLTAMPGDSGMAFILVQHLPPESESTIVDVLSTRTTMPVLQADDGMEVKANHVYVIRPGHTSAIENGLLHLREPVEKQGHQRPIDDFFRSLAEEQRERAIGVIMAGMGSNGLSGAQQIKVVGGVCIAQDPETTQFPSMPRHLIESGAADFVLAPRHMPEVLIRYATHPYTRGTGATADATRGRERQQLNDILAILRTYARQDFTAYKKPTVLRRIQRRMGLNHVNTMGEYVKILRQNQAEVSALADDLMIHVTGFFRDAPAWEILRNRVIAPLIAEREAEGQIRCWVTACSSGEEAYTLAMLIAEALDKAEKSLDVKIFATDTAQRTLAQARSGVYPGGIESEIDPKRLERFFDRDDSFYRVKKSLRDMVIVAPQNVLYDHPFSRLDIITCRNLLIYVEPQMQQRVFTLFHFGLRENGALMLGTSETTSGAEELFEPVDKQWKIYRRIGVSRYSTVELPSPAVFSDKTCPDHRPVPRGSIAQLTNKLLLDRYTPAAVTIDREHRIVHFHGNTDTYLSLPRGEPTRELLPLVKEELRGAVRTALHRAMTEQTKSTEVNGLIDVKDRGRCRVAVTVEPLEQLAADFLLVSFEERPDLVLPPAPSGEAPVTGRELEDELHRVRGELQSAIEELQTSNEELKASNEEIMSVNEELQSTNEELETSKEELQSLNEELTTVSSQLGTKVEELEQATNDLSSLLSSTDIAVIFLDRNSRIRRYTPAIKELIDLIPTDIGRPINDMATKFTDPNLHTDARVVLEKLVPASREISSQTGKWYIRQITPYRTMDDRIDGVVITFIDITSQKIAEQQLKEAKHAAEAATNIKDEFLATLSHELRTPLSAILLWTRILREKNIDPQQLMEGLEVIERSAEAQKTLVDDLLDTSRITSGKLRLEMRDVNLINLIRSAIEMIAPAAQAKRIHIYEDLQPNVGIVRADSDRLRQVVWNLLTNAVKFTPPDGKATVSLRRQADIVEIQVSDTGKGISPDFLPQLFAPFCQSDGSMSRRHAGLGLGLAICKSLVELHGGTIEAKSPGVHQGATFIIRVPLPPVSPDSDQRDDSNLNLASSLQSGVPPATTVLLVEDEAATRKALQAFLDRAGLHVTAVSSAKEAMEALERSRPDVIISDLGMPEVDGCSLLRLIREREQLNRDRPVPAIALTAFAREEDRARAISAGFQRHLAKPIAPERLLADLYSLTSGREVGQA